MQRFVSVKNVT